MFLAIILVLLAVGSVIFHFVSTWWATPIASNWGSIDDAITVTFWITGFAYVAVILFMACSSPPEPAPFSLNERLVAAIGSGADVGLRPEHHPGHGIWWAYGLVIGGLIACLCYVKWRGTREPAAKKALHRRLADLEHAQESWRKQLRNAVDYPMECSLTDAERKARLDSVAALQRLIDEVKSELALPAA